MTEKELVNLPHGFVGGFNGQHWCIWESIEDFRNGFFPYEAECVRKNGRMVFQKIMTEAEAKKFATRCYRAIKRKDSEGV